MNSHLPSILVTKARLMLAAMLIGCILLSPAQFTTTGAPLGANFVDCDCDEPLYTRPVAYSDEETIEIWGEYFYSPNDLCTVPTANHIQYNDSEPLTTCGASSSEMINDGGMHSSSTGCISKDGDANVDAVITAVAGNHKITAQFDGALDVTSEVSTVCDSKKCPGSSVNNLAGSGIDGSIWIPFELCREQKVTVRLFVKLGPCTVSPTGFCSVGWNLGGQSDQAVVGNSDSDDPSLVFNLQPGDYTLKVNFDCGQSICAAAFCPGNPSDGGSCAPAIEGKVEVSFADP